MTFLAAVLPLALAASSLPVDVDVDVNVDVDAYTQSRQAALYDIELRLREETPALLDDTQRDARMAALTALRTYADAGVFPHNHHSPTAVPLFIDEHDTPCAVAFMIFTSDGATGAGEALARAIASDHNHVLLPHDERIAQWAATHGLTLDELARIQEPGYDVTDYDDDVREQARIAKMQEAKRKALAEQDALKRGRDMKRTVDVARYHKMKKTAHGTNNARL